MTYVLRPVRNPRLAAVTVPFDHSQRQRIARRREAATRQISHC